jgi:hypothetical protein
MEHENTTLSTIASQLDADEYAPVPAAHVAEQTALSRDLYDLLDRAYQDMRRSRGR